MVKVGIIGGSGLDDKLDMSDVGKVKIHTPYGATSDLVVIGKIGPFEVAAIARHGADHRIMPSMVNYRANIWALKEMGVTHVIAATACGSLREEIRPGHLVFIDQFIDRTAGRSQSFYEGTQVCHIPMAEPFCARLRAKLSEAAGRLNIRHHDRGTMVTIEGPRFSTKAESNMFRLWGGDVINMSTVPEVVLAREAGLCYASVAMSTDYDCWHETEEPVSIERILEVMSTNAENVNRLFPEVLPMLDDSECECRSVFRRSII